MRLAALDDDVVQLDMIRHAVKSLGWTCEVFDCAEALLAALRRDSFDLLMVDWQLPDISGPDVVRWVRARLDHPVPILFLTQRAEERDVVEALTCGADDFMSKPVRVQELMARLKALLRRSHQLYRREPAHFGGFCIEAPARSISFEGETIELKQKEFELARCLFSNQGRLLSRSYLTEAVWGNTVVMSSRTLDTHICTLRTKLGLRPARGFRLAAVYGQGYRLEALSPSQESGAGQRESEPA